VSEAEIWWANHRANIEVFECKDWMIRGCNIDRARVSAVRIQGRTGSGRDTPDGFHENGFLIGNTFKNFKGAAGAGSDGDGPFIRVINSRGPVISSNNFNMDIAAGDVKVSYIVEATGSKHLTFTGNNYPTFGDSYQPWLTGIISDLTAFSSLDLEGSWNPVVTDASSNTGTASTAAGRFSISSGVVTVTATLIDIDTTGLVGTDELRITGLPVSAYNSSTYSFSGSLQMSQVSPVSGGYAYVPSISGGSAHLVIRESISAANRDTLKVSEFTSGSADVWLTVTYSINQQ
jgi:hypothetical protein